MYSPTDEEKEDRLWKLYEKAQERHKESTEKFKAEIEGLKREKRELEELTRDQQERERALFGDADFLFEKLAAASGGEEVLRKKRVTCQWWEFHAPKACGAPATMVLPRPQTFVCPIHRKQWEEEVDKAREENGESKRHKSK